MNDSNEADTQTLRAGKRQTTRMGATPLQYPMNANNRDCSESPSSSSMLKSIHPPAGRPWALLGGQLCSKWWQMREIRQPRDLAGLRGSWLERGGDNFKSSLRPQRCVTCHPGAGAQGPNRHGSCTQPLPSRRQGLERDLPSLAAEPQLLPGPPGSLVLSANLQVLCGCLPTCSSRSLWGFSGHPSGVVTRPPDNLVGIKHPVL